MDKRLEQLVDWTEIRELTARYNRAFDDQEAEAWAEVFTPDGTLEVEGGLSVTGRDALVAMCRSTGWGTVHITADPTITVDGDRATQTCTLVLARRERDPDRSEFQLTGRYVDELVRTDAGWRFRARHIKLDASTA